MKIILLNDEIKRLLTMAIEEGWLESDYHFTPDVNSIEFDAKFQDGSTIVTATIDIGTLE